MNSKRSAGCADRVMCVVGARPNFMKIAPLVKEFKRRNNRRITLLHTGQHYSPEMSDGFFRDLGIPEPDVNLGAGGGEASEQIAEILKRLDPVLRDERPGLMVVVGDVNSTLAATLAAVKRSVPVAHVEAGLRSFDRSMPEEINRILTDAVSDYLFASEPSGVRNLRAEGVPASKVFLVGNVMIDTLLACRERARQSGILDRLGLAPRSYALATLHRPSNVDDVERLRELLSTLSGIREQLPVVFPMHPRTSARIAGAGLSLDGITTSPPLGYLDFLKLMDSARLVLTDSGGIQEETTVLGVPCLTLRENTERPVTIEQGSNRLAGCSKAEVLRTASEALRSPRSAKVPDLWDGKASQRIVDVLDRI